jgi:hypothetical protein
MALIKLKVISGIIALDPARIRQAYPDFRFTGGTISILYASEKGENLQPLDGITNPPEEIITAANAAGASLIGLNDGNPLILDASRIREAFLDPRNPPNTTILYAYGDGIYPEPIDLITESPSEIALQAQAVGVPLHALTVCGEAYLIDLSRIEKACIKEGSTTIMYMTDKSLPLEEVRGIEESPAEIMALMEAVRQNAGPGTKDIPVPGLHNSEGGPC